MGLRDSLHQTACEDWGYHPELGTGSAGSARAGGAVRGDRLSWDTSLTHPATNPQVDGQGDMVPPPSASSSILEVL